MAEQSGQLIFAFGSLITYAMHVNRYPERFEDLEEVVRAIDTLVEEAKSNVEQIDPALWPDTLFPVAAFVDELLLLSPWAYKQHWLSAPLQKKYFGTVDAGVLFFTRLDALAPEEKPLSALYVYVLHLGFKGKFYHSDDSGDIERRIAEHHDAYGGAVGDDPAHQLFDDALLTRVPTSSGIMPLKIKKALYAVGLLGAVILSYYYFETQLQASLSTLHPASTSKAACK